TSPPVAARPGIHPAAFSSGLTQPLFTELPNLRQNALDANCSSGSAAGRETNGIAASPKNCYQAFQRFSLLLWPGYAKCWSSPRSLANGGPNKMSKIILTAFMLPLLLFLGSTDGGSPNASRAANTSPGSPGESGTLQKMIVASGSATVDLDLDRINGISSTTGRSEADSSRKLSELHFAVAPNSFFPVLVFNNMLRGPKPGSMGLVPQNNVVLPPVLAASL